MGYNEKLEDVLRCLSRTGLSRMSASLDKILEKCIINCAMIDYMRIYKKFIATKGLSGINCTKANGRRLNLERHHILPKSLGGVNDRKNYVYLTEDDHCIAHILLQMAMIQHGKPIDHQYALRGSLDDTNSYFVLKWNPVSKIKIKLISKDYLVCVMPVCQATRYACANTGIDFDSLDMKSKNLYIRRLLQHSWQKNGHYCGCCVEMVA